MKCPKCNTHMQIDDSRVYTSIPPQYDYVCPNCGHSAIGTRDRDNEDVAPKVAKYHVCCESWNSAFGNVLFGNPYKCFEVTLNPEFPVNAQRFYDVINKDKADRDKTGNIISWSKIID